ncbi:MAG: Mur ligase family protein [Gammaproteobacteria bacterium]|jgi:UDP-N-acetylmuramate: L-alanyl-gamma-D-glutamyl-meso-diaminopimelate ligase|nr:Mur ligase family protein [Pseudomonadota bacterium]|tara:strand:- start:4504 stop:5721 length:1218 start_codon:yes stop_codon:yes gene_type:complete
MKIFFLGISGTFMGNLAQMASHLGHDVAGVDQKVYPPMSDELAKSGISFKEGYTEENFQDADIYILGNVISKDNPLLIKILSHGKNIMSGPEWLYENVLKDKKVIAVSGTHGKTTVTTMIAHALLEQGENPGYLIAGVPKMLKKSWNISDSKFFVIEADEYDTSCFDKEPKFFHYRPHILLINNIEFDHADIFSNIEEIESKFFSLLESLDADSMAYINKDAVSNRFLEKSFIFNAVEAFSAGTTTIDEINKNLATKALSKYFSSSEIHDSLKSFSGVKRRYDVIFENDDFKVIDDFAHHPTAIIETLKLAKKESFNVILILELGSNSMRKGIHDEKLIEIMQDQKTFTINASQDQLEKFSHLSKELNLDLVKQITSKPTEKHIILMCGNRNFSGFQKSILDALI